MDDLSRKFRSLDWKTFQKSARRMQASTASALKDLVMTDLENKTRSATSDTPWGASTTDLQTIAQGTYNRDDYALIMSIVWQRLGSSRWRCVYKALDVLKYLMMHGSNRCLEEASGAVGHVEALRAYRKVEGGRDVGEGVRRRAEGVVEMLRDESVLQREREKSEELRRKMVGGGSGVGYGTGYGGRYDEEAGSRVGTAAFKGYDDDDEGGGVTGGFKGYDDDARLKGYGEEEGQKAGVDDLLGGEDLLGHEAKGVTEEDDGFNPRGNSQVEEVGELFGALAVAESDGGVAVGTGEGIGGEKVESTSARIARLAAEKGGGVAAGAVVPVDGTTVSGVWDDDVGIWNESPPSSAAAKGTKVLKREEKDAFSELVATARKTVL